MQKKPSETELRIEKQVRDILQSMRTPFHNIEESAEFMGEHLRDATTVKDVYNLVLVARAARNTIASEINVLDMYLEGIQNKVESEVMTAVQDLRRDEQGEKPAKC